MTTGTPAGRRTRDELIAYALLALAMLSWSGNHVVGRLAAGHVPPFAISLFRWGVPVVLLWPFVREHLRRDWPVIKENWRTLLFLGLTGGAVFGVLQYVGLRYTTAINVSVLNSLAPVMIALAGAALFRDRLRWQQGGGIAVSLLGVALIITKADLKRAAGLDFNWGDLIILFNVAIWAIYSVCLRWRPRMHWISFTYCLGLVSTVATLPFFVGEQAVVQFGGRDVPVLSRIGDAGADYTGRTNKCAHHVIFMDAGELNAAGPAWSALEAGFFDTKWTGDPRELPPNRKKCREALRPRTSAALILLIV